MALESISFLTYFLARLPAAAPAAADAMLIQQGDAVKQIAFSSLVEALSLEIGGGTPVTLIAETTLTAEHGTVFINPAEGATVSIHLPVYDVVSGRKRYSVKNIGQGLVNVDAADGKTVDGELTMSPLAPGDRCGVAKDGINWQTVL